MLHYCYYTIIIISMLHLKIGINYINTVDSFPVSIELARTESVYLCEQGRERGKSQTHISTTSYILE